MTVGRGGYEIFADKKIAPESAIPPWSKPPGHPLPAAMTPMPWTEARKVGSSAEPMDLHSRNFLDCIKSRNKPAADVEWGHEISTACHLANISMRLGRQIRWNAAKEDVIGDAEASQWLERPYRQPWDAVIRRLKLS